MSDLTLSQEQYLALVALARKGATTSDEKRALEAFLKDIEKTNQVSRYFLLVQWQDMTQPLPPSTRFPEVWPPELRTSLERTDRPIAKSDVTAAVSARSSKPTNIMVTKDPGGIVGWTPVDDFFIT